MGLANKIKVAMRFFFKTFCFLVFGAFLFSPISDLNADEYTSASFKVLDPITSSGASFSTSSSYQLESSFGQISIGTSSTSSFGLSAGFLYFPFVTAPVISPTAGDGQVSLSWTSATSALGWTISGYNVGTATVSGGPYTFGLPLGLVLSDTITGLSNGTTYYFVVGVLDAFGNTIATSSQVSATPVSATPSPVIGISGAGYIVPAPAISCDFNSDQLCNFVDLSILLYWFGKTGPEIAFYDLNLDGRISFVDISILLYRWKEA